MRLRNLAQSAIAIAMVLLSACSGAPRRPVPLPEQVMPSITMPPLVVNAQLLPTDESICASANPGRTARFKGRTRLRSGVDACLYSKPDVIMSMSPPLGPRYVQLLAPAQQGNPEAQFKLAATLNQCATTPDTPQALKTTLTTALKTRRYLGGVKVEDPKSFERLLRQEFADCDGVDPAERGRSREWARRAAEAGLMDAQESLMFMSRPGSVYYLWSRDTKENNQRDAAHYTATMAALVAAREAGSVDALITLAGRYAQESRDNPPWEREYFDPLKSYAHFAAFDQIQQARGGKRRQPLKGTVAGDLYSRLTPVQRVAAEELATTFVSNPRCCVVTE